MSASSTQKAKDEMIIFIARKIRKAVDAITKSKEVSKEFYLLATKVQDETTEIQDKIIWIASKFFVDDWTSGKTDPNNEFGHFMGCLDEAYDSVKDE